MLNIVMNVEGIDLGEKLRAFKESTKDLSTALRGHQISKNNFIRTIHNSFTRRMDHLNADLCLENEASDAKTSTSKRRTAAKKGKRVPPRRKRSNAEYGYHFIAYVPAGGYVWELDGLQYKPHKLGKLSATIPGGLANFVHQIAFLILVIGHVWQDHRSKAECFNMKRVSSPSTF